MPKLLPLGFGSTGMIVPRFLATAGFMSRPHVLNLICSAELQGAHMLNDPALTHAINAPATHYAGATRPLPGLEPAPA